MDRIGGRTWNRSADGFRGNLGARARTVRSGAAAVEPRPLVWVLGGSAGPDRRTVTVDQEWVFGAWVWWSMVTR